MSLTLFLLSKVTVLAGRVNAGTRRFLHELGHFVNVAESHTACLAVFYTGRLFSLCRTLGAKVAESGGIGNEIHVDVILVNAYSNQFLNLYTAHTAGKIMLLLAGDLTGVTPGTIFVFDEQSFSCHVSTPLVLYLCQTALAGAVVGAAET